jgi:hypothetical protein
MSSNIGEVFQTAPEFTNVRQYFEPLRVDIEWWDLKHLEQVHSFSSWNPRGTGVANHIPVIDAAVTPPGTSQYGAFNFRVWDTDKVIDPQTVRRKGIIVMKCKKYQNDPYENLIYGFITKVRMQLLKNQLYYQITGAGSGIVLNERFVNMQRTARMKAIDSDVPLFDDELMEVRRLYKDLLTDKNLYVVDDVAIKDQFNPAMDVSVLDNSVVNDTLLSLNQPYVVASNVLNSLLDSVGADGGIGPDNKPYLTYPLSRTPTTTLKSWDTISDQGLDRSGNTAYFMDSWDYEIDWSQEAGFSNRLLAKSRVTQGTSTASTEGTYGGFETLQDIDLAQKIPASPARFRDLAVIVSRVGEGTINPTTKSLHGHIHQDLNNAPVGSIVARFDIPLASIPEDNPTAMFLTGLSFTNVPFNPSSAHWIILYERGNIGGSDTINWFYNTDDTLNGTIARRPFIAGTPRAADHEVNSGWEVTSNNSFNFVFSVLDSFTHIIIGEDVDSQERYGLVEDIVDVSWTSNTIAANKALGEILSMRCLPKVTYSTNSVTIPGRLFMPGQIVRVEDARSNLTSVEGAMAEVSNASYLFGGSGTSQLGADVCDISLVGHYDFKLEEEAFGTGTE